MTPYALILLAWLGLRLVFSRRNKPRWEPWEGRTAAIIPTYNEDPAALQACVDSLRGQVDVIYVVDDGSDVPVWDEDLPYLPGRVVVLHQRNSGKRAALALVIRDLYTGAVVVTVDSDTVVAPGAVRKLVAAFSDPNVHAATGVVRAANPKTNLLTRLIDLRYGAAFLGERAAYSHFGSVLCCCGSLAAYRVSTVRPHMDDLENQTFLGRKVQGGDDRRMTNYALWAWKGKAVLVEDAKATTLVPERLSHFARQQTRWSRSFLRETLWALGNLRGRAWALAAVELVVQVALTIGVVVGSFRLAAGMPLIAYFFWTGTAAVARMSPAMRDKSTPRAPIWLAPVYGLMHLVMLMPLRIYAFATVRDGSWGTRSKVEVSV